MLDVISRLELAVQHGVFLHTHESGVVIRFGVAVPVPAYVQLIDVITL